MPRKPRLLLSHSYYHIIMRGNNRLKIFKSQDDYQYYLSLLVRFKKNHPFDLFHYCLMPNHIHFLIYTRSANDFSIFMKKINLAYFYYFKNHYGWVGHLWQDRFRSQPVGKDAYFIQCGKYIELNPVRAEIVAKPDNYLYSSYNFYTKGQPSQLLTEDIFFTSMGKTAKERREKYGALVISDIIIKSYQKKIWGSGGERYNENRKIRYHTKG